MIKPVIGLEFHSELKTNSKVFSKAKNEYNEIPNINVSALDIALPGTLPILNKNAVKSAIKVALCLNCDIADTLLFDRKNYYYPDLPKGYQITQLHKPIGINGKFSFLLNNEERIALIRDVHLEEDTASLDHYDEYSLLNYNRCGVPLLETVTEPCFSSAEEAVEFLQNLISILRYCDISEADTKKGQIRCDVNVNLKEDDKYLTPRIEVKNVNSISGIFNTINYEIDRQLNALKNNVELFQETRRWDEEKGITIKMRSKEDAIDYKYFVEPNIPEIKIEKDFIDSAKNEIPELPSLRRKKYLNQYGLSEYDTNILVNNKLYSDYFDKLITNSIDAKIAANWVISEILGILNKENITIEEFFLTPEMLVVILNKMIKKEISSKQAKEIFNKSIKEKVHPNTLLNNYNQVSNQDELEEIIKRILDSNQNLITEYKNGRNNVFDFFVGQVMKETRGSANPVLTKELLNIYLNKKED